MKINKSKFLVAGMLTAMSLATIGSVASTYAWYTYNTKDTVAFRGITGGKSENLIMRGVPKSGTAGDWTTSLSSDDLIAYSTGDGYAGSTLSPVTPASGLAVDGTLSDTSFYGAPSAYDANFYNNNTKSDGKYVFFKINFDIECVNPNSWDESSSKYTEMYSKAVYISYLDLTMTTVDEGGSVTKDVSDAVRMHICSDSNNVLIAPGIASGSSLNLYGPLHLDTLTTERPDGSTIEYDEGVSLGGGLYRKPNEFDYEVADRVQQITYGTNGAKETFKGHDDIVQTFSQGKISGSAPKIAQTKTDAATRVTMYIFLEGWASSIVGTNINATFDLSMQLEVEKLDLAA